MKNCTHTVLIIVTLFLSCESFNKDINEVKNTPLFDIGMTNKNGAIITLSPGYIAEKIAGENGSLQWRTYEVSQDYRNKLINPVSRTWQGEKIGIEVEINRMDDVLQQLIMRYVLVKDVDNPNKTLAISYDKVIIQGYEFSYDDFFRSLRSSKIDYYNTSDF